MRVQIALVVEHDDRTLNKTRRVELATTIYGAKPYGGNDPVIGAINAASDMTKTAVKAVTP